MDIFHMSDIIPLIGLPYPPYGRSNYNVPCPCCDDEPHAKHLNINLQKDVFRCPRCGFSGGIFDLYAYYTGIAREEVRDALIARLDVQGSIPKPEHIPVPVVAEVPPADRYCIKGDNASSSAVSVSVSVQSHPFPAGRNYRCHEGIA